MNINLNTIGDNLTNSLLDKTNKKNEKIKFSIGQVSDMVTNALSMVGLDYGSLDKKSKSLVDESIDSVVARLKDNDQIKVQRGFDNYSETQISLKRFWDGVNGQGGLLETLAKHGKATIEISDVARKDIINDNNRYFVIDKVGKKIHPSINFSNVERPSKKEQQEN